MTIKDRISRIIMAVLAVLIGVYPAIYFIIDRKFGLLQSKPDEVLNSSWWNVAFYTHITLGGLALLIGWTQFSVKLRTKNVRIHRLTGKTYVVAVLVSSVAAGYLAWFATAGIVASLGFACLAAIWFFTTLTAYRFIRQKRTDEHQRMMIFSYAACFAAVTLRIYLPLLQILFHDFSAAYRTVAWLCWVPNVVVAYFLARRIPSKLSAAIV